jgi:hypothetical protein
MSRRHRDDGRRDEFPSSDRQLSVHRLSDWSRRISRQKWAAPTMRMPVTVTAISLLRAGIDHTLNRFSLVSQAAPNPECRQHECPGSGYLPQVVIPDLGHHQHCQPQQHHHAECVHDAFTSGGHRSWSWPSRVS